MDNSLLFHFSMLFPSTSTSPSSFAIRREIILITVDFPAPFGPIRQSLSLSVSQRKRNPQRSSHHTVFSTHGFSKINPPFSKQKIQEINPAPYCNKYTNRNCVDEHLLYDHLPPARTIIPNSADPAISCEWRYVFKSCLDRFAMISPRNEIGPTIAVAIAIQSATPSKSLRIARS